MGSMLPLPAAKSFQSFLDPKRTKTELSEPSIQNIIFDNDLNSNILSRSLQNDNKSSLIGIPLGEASSRSSLSDITNTAASALQTYRYFFIKPFNILFTPLQCYPLQK
jgi:hypothetical protein